MNNQSASWSPIPKFFIQQATHREDVPDIDSTSNSLSLQSVRLDYQMANCHSAAKVSQHDWATRIGNIKNHSDPADGHCQSLSALTIITRVHCSQTSWKCVLSAHHEGRDTWKQTHIWQRYRRFERSFHCLLKMCDTVNGVVLRPLNKQLMQLNLAYKCPLRQKESIWLIRYKRNHSVFCSR